MPRINAKTQIPVTPETIAPDITFSDFYRIYYHDMEVRLKPSSLASKKQIFSRKTPLSGKL